MKIIIDYNDSWSASNLIGNRETHFNKVRPQVNDIVAFNNENEKLQISQSKYLPRKDELTANTIMGILYRLVGDIRPLHLIKSKENYLRFINDKEFSLSFKKENITETLELLTFQNVGNRFKENDKKGYYNPDNPNSWEGEINETNKVFLEKELYQILFYPFVCTPIELYDLIVKNTFKAATNLNISDGRLRILTLNSKINSSAKFSLEDNEDAKIRSELLENLRLKITSARMASGFTTPVKYEDKSKNKYETFVYGALYMCFDHICNEFNVTMKDGVWSCDKFGVLQTDKNAWHSGISLGTITPKDIIGKIAKKANVNSYPIEENTSESKVRTTVHSGTIVIDINLPSEEAEKIKEMIDEANIGIFRLGKKGTAYLREIEL